MHLGTIDQKIGELKAEIQKLSNSIAKDEQAMDNLEKKIVVDSDELKKRQIQHPVLEADWRAADSDYYAYRNKEGVEKKQYAMAQNNHTISMLERKLKRYSEKRDELKISLERSKNNLASKKDVLEDHITIRTQKAAEEASRQTQKEASRQTKFPFFQQEETKNKYTIKMPARPVADYHEIQEDLVALETKIARREMDLRNDKSLLDSLQKELEASTPAFEEKKKILVAESKVLDDKKSQVEKEKAAIESSIQDLQKKIDALSSQLTQAEKAALTVVADLTKELDSPTSQPDVTTVVTKRVDDQLRAVLESTSLSDAALKTSSVKLYIQKLLDQKTVAKDALVARITVAIQNFGKKAASAKTNLDQVKTYYLDILKKHAQDYGKPVAIPQK